MDSEFDFRRFFSDVRRTPRPLTPERRHMSQGVMALERLDNGIADNSPVVAEDEPNQRGGDMRHQHAIDGDVEWFSDDEDDDAAADEDVAALLRRDSDEDQHRLARVLRNLESPISSSGDDDAGKHRLRGHHLEANRSRESHDGFYCVSSL